MAISMFSIGFTAFAEESELALGAITSVTVPNSGSVQAFTFTPKKNGYYIFRSHAPDHLDPLCYINDSKGEPVGDSPYDDSDVNGYSRNFYARVHLQAGEQYSFVCGLGSNVGVTFPVSYNVDLNVETLGKPTGIKLTARGGDGERAKIEWNAVPGATKYEIIEITNGINRLKGTATTTNFTFTDLVPGWTYEVKVVAYCENGKLAESEGYTFGAACPTVQNLKASVTGTNTIEAEWDVTTSHGYRLEWSTSADFSKDVNGTYISGTNSTSYTIKTEKPADQYYVRVRAYKLFNDSTIYGAFTQPVGMNSTVE